MRPTLVFSLFLVAAVALVLPGTASAQPAATQPVSLASASGEGAVYYVIRRGATLFSQTDPERPYLRLGFREPVYLKKSEGAWSLVRTQDGAQGYVKTDVLSNIWIRVSKRRKALYLYRGTELILTAPTDFGYNAFADKERQGNVNNPDHWRTPEGTFFVAKKNPYSKFYKAFVLNYPTAEDAERGLRRGLISKTQHSAIVQAEASFQMPPMYTALGGMIEIHGHGTGGGTNWTQGCMAVEDGRMDDLWEWVEVGTPVLVER